MRRQSLSLIFFAAVCVQGLAQQASAGAADLASKQATSSVKVGLFLVPPFVMQEGNSYSGMAVDLWQNAAAKMGVTYQYQLMPTLPDLLSAVSSGKIDIAVGDIPITEETLARMDFTQPWFDSGLRVTIDRNRHPGFVSLLRSLWASGHLEVLLWIGICVAVATLMLTAIDRKFDDDFPDQFHKGVVESFYHVMSIVTSGKTTHKSLFGVYGRLLAALWMICGVTIVAYLTSSITSVMTTSSLANQINGRADLVGKKIGVLRGAVAQTYCFDEALQCQAFDRSNDVAQALLDGKIAAIVADASVLQYYGYTHPKWPIIEVGTIFRPLKYGFAAPRGSALVRPMSLAIVADIQEGFVDRLHAKYFGPDP
ncbi:transporter substrate-binding domain-containing protein [Acidisoma sp. L85]|uniref:transporter substrate-binding domain-containing protein n=1 Tax=Acidisoma sp. L85 TaxID=1641850 RepID=UPI00131A98AD|nr:transporter substrate-binding domain-containing protein [Acidisoma sp. L85]